MAPPQILIVGTGIAGPTLATFLLQSPLPAPRKPHITLLERAPAIRPQGQNIDIRGAGVTIIRKLGLETAIRGATTGEAGVQHVDARNRVWAALPAGKHGAPTSDVEILRGRLAKILYERCKDVSGRVEREEGRGVEFLFGETVSAVRQEGDGVEVFFAKSGERRRYDVVVGADGLQSSTRKTVWGDEDERERVYGLGMYAAFFKIPRGPTDTQWRRWYHIPGRRGIKLRPDDTGKQTTVLMSVINEDDAVFEDTAAKTGQEGVKVQKELMRACFEGVGWESKRVLKGMMETKDFYYDMVAQVKMDRWSKGRVVLLGDAGYCASPISGMGTTLALNGAYNLAGALTRHPNDYSAAFAEYEETMRPIVDKAQKLFPGAPHTLSPETEWGIWVLNFIVWIIAASRIGSLLFIFLGPPADYVPVKDYDLTPLEEDSSFT